MAQAEAQKQKEAIEAQMALKLPAVDIEESLLNDGDLSQLPDRRLTEMGKKMDEDEDQINSSTNVTAPTMISLEQYEEKTDEIERLQDLLSQEQEKLKETLKQVSDLNEALKIAEDRTKAAIAEKEKFGDKNREMIFKMQSM